MQIDDVFEFMSPLAERDRTWALLCTRSNIESTFIQMHQSHGGYWYAVDRRLHRENRSLVEYHDAWA